MILKYYHGAYTVDANQCIINDTIGLFAYNLTEAKGYVYSYLKEKYPNGSIVWIGLNVITHEVILGTKSMKECKE